MATLTACASKNAERIVLFGAGKVSDVLEGRPPTSDAWISLTPYRAAFEAGSPQGITSIGEFIAFNGVGFSRSTEESTKGQLLVGRKVVTNAAVFLHQNTKPSRIVDLVAPCDLAELVERLTREADGPVCYVGVATFEHFRSTAIERAPIYGKNIFEHSKVYYPTPPQTARRVRAAIMGCAARAVVEDGVDLSVVLYRNPNDRSHEVLSHTHALTVGEHVQTIDDVVPTTAGQVHHVFADSVLARATLEVYYVSRVQMLW